MKEPPSHVLTGSARVVTLLLLADILLTGCGGGEPSAPEVTGSVDAGWATGSITAHRDGWGALASVTVEDREDDGDCVYANIRLVLGGAAAVERSTGEVCGTGKRISETFDLRPGYQGTSIDSIELEVLRDRNALLPDPAVSTTVVLPQMTARANRQEADETLTYMDASIDDFEASRASAPGPWDWNSDGCSVPDFFPDVVVGTYKDLFLDACHRHDFGYRNYGRRLIDPTDQRREWIDGIFLTDMRTACEAVAALEQPACEQAAVAFQLAVRNFGGTAFYGP